MLSRTAQACALLLFLTGCAAAPGPPPAPLPKCAKLDDMLHALEKNARYAYTADAIDAHEEVHMWFINPKTRAWVQLHVSSDLQACVEAQGTDWHWALDH